jgi:Plasmid pRiA4b ORF-3-like protein
VTAKRELAAKKPSAIYQFKITLLDVKPTIWRRIQVPDCTLENLHDHVQTAMGWTNSHLHQFDIGGRRCGDPALLDDGGGDEDIIDSTELRLSELLEKQQKSFRFFYEYDFGDGWRHEIAYEGMQPAEAGAKYPCCVAGARACPPEDVGGPGGYHGFLDTIRDPKHEDHDNMLEWIGGKFDPDGFNAEAATNEMRRGLPNWRDMR